ncbi:winged helix-turn-helix transcriptional regulator [Rheinheimera pacifica]|uniref:winged helix-turn-helix transcriptional regulator n=1 Tax=Rheinheimera pacifica TaxID=173990 RepID=UPI001C434FBE|nr:winged helix-turn-helix transcriptional regulator [Rheinheimera pacifica]
MLVQVETFLKYRLLHGFTALDALIPGLEVLKIVSRTVHPTIPVKVEYALTQDGQRLNKVVTVVEEFGKWLKARDAT